MESKNADFVRKNWGKVSLEDMTKKLSISLYELLTIAFELGMHKVGTPDAKRHWTESEDQFLKDYAHLLTTKDACNLLYRSRYATYQRVKFLNLRQMIGK